MFWSTLINNYIKDTSNITFDDYMTSIKNETINNNNNNNNFSSNNNSTNNSTKNKNNNNNTNISDASSILSTNQFGLSPSGKISLIVTKIIRKQFNITKNIFANVTVSDSNNSSNKDGTNNTKNRNSSTNNNNNNKNSNSSNNLLLNAFQSTDISVLCPIPNDISTLLLSGNHGKVSKIVRFGEPSNPKDFRRPEIGKMEISAISGKNGR